MDKARINWPLLLGFWAVIAGILVAKAILTAQRVPLLNDTDDAMRLVVVRDFLAGQGWYDHLQHRLNTPFGAELHWSRLVDLPIAGLLLLLSPLGANSGTAVAYVWPLLLLLALMWVTAKLTLKLVGPAGILAALALPILSPAVAAEFSPGRIDHHSVQILLTLLLVWCTIEALERPRWAIGAGLAAATALAIGTEALPAVAAGALAFALIWAVRPDRYLQLRYFGVSLAGGALIHLMLTWPPERWLDPMCDAISIVYVVGALGVALFFVFISVLPFRNRAIVYRLGALAISGAAVLGLLVQLYPDCIFHGPYAALDPWLVTNWLSNISEAKPLWQSLADVPDLTLGIALPPLLALVAIVWWAQKPGAERWLVLGLYLAVATVVMVVQVRGGRLADAIAVPAAAGVIAAIRARYLATRSLLWAGGLIVSWIAFAGIAVLILVYFATLPFTPEGAAEAEVKAAAATESCLMPSAFAELAALPPERIMSEIDLGSHLLAFTPHAVVAAPYHRNQQGVRDAFRFLNDPVADARAILEARGIGLVVICPAMSEMSGLADAAPDSFVRLYRAGTLPAWLVDQSLPGSPLKVYAVTPDPARP